jgi:hypothetical protein
VITPDALDRLRTTAVAQAGRLSRSERNRLAALALALVQVRDATLSKTYADTALGVLHGAAPSLAVELGRLLDAAEPLVSPDLGELP